MHPAILILIAVLSCIGSACFLAMSHEYHSRYPTGRTSTAIAPGLIGCLLGLVAVGALLRLVLLVGPLAA